MKLQIQILFDKYDDDGGGTIDIMEFCNGLLAPPDLPKHKVNTAGIDFSGHKPVVPKELQQRSDGTLNTPLTS